MQAADEPSSLPTLTSVLYYVVVRPPTPNTPYREKSILLTDTSTKTNPDSITFGVPAAFFLRSAATYPTGKPQTIALQRHTP
jgi:hypothetical protein